MRSEGEPGRLFEDIVRSRRSCRAFRPDPVDHATIRSILTLAGAAPSGCNAQPWITHVVSGDATARLRAALLARAEAEMPFDPDVPITPAYPGPYRARQIGAAVALFEAQNVARHDPAGRKRSFLRNFAFFDAPHVAFIFLDEAFGFREALDCGLFAQTFMLALAAHGIASCAQGALSHYAGIVHEALDVPREHRLLMGMAFGYAAASGPTQMARNTRADIDELVTFHEI